MKRAILLAGLLGAAPIARADVPALLPRPAAIAATAGPGAEIGPNTAIRVSRGDAAALAAAQWLRDELATTVHWHVPIVVGGPAAHAINLATARDVVGAEAYRLDVADGRVTIRASGSAGLFYGAVSLWQMLTPNAGGGSVNLAAVAIADQPRFAWRGLMLDSARHMQSVDYVERYIDWLALHKFNTFHWHLTDDQGWRIAIKGFPRLTTVAAWRKPVGPDALDDQGRPVSRYGGFYTQAQIRQVVAFAARRHVTIVPELDLPGHSTALLYAYPDLAVPGVTPEPVTADSGLLPGVLNVDEHTIGRVEQILDQVMDLFPGRYIHLGGDEVDISEWRGSPQVQARMKALGIPDEESLERWLIGRLGSYVEAHGRRLVGWDEIQNGAPGSPQDTRAVIMTWHMGPGAAKAILSGHQTVMAQAPLYYLDNRQTNAPTEPPGWTDIETSRAIYLHDPVPAGLTPDQARLVLGVQGQEWTERARKQDWITRQVWPRAAALAEVAWSPPIGAADADWADFAQRLAVQRTRYPLVGLIDGEVAQGHTNSDARHRVSLDLDFCAPDTTGLVVEAPRVAGQAEGASDVGPTVKFANRQLCWAWRGAALDGVGHIDLSLVHLAFAERLGSKAPILHVAHGPMAIEVHLDRVDGPLAGTLPLTDFGDRMSGQVAIAATSGTHDLYFVLTGPDIDSRSPVRPPLTVIDTVTLR
jgi:hexosaminidase